MLTSGKSDGIRQCALLVWIDLLLLHRERRVLWGLPCLSIMVAAIMAISERTFAGALHGMIDPGFSLVIISLTLTQGFRDYYAGWGITLRHATLFALPVRRYLVIKNAVAWILIALPNLLGVELLMVFHRSGCSRMISASLLAASVSGVVLIVWNLWLRLSPLMQQQEVLLFVVSLAALFLTVAAFSVASTIHPGLGVVFTVALLASVVRGVSSSWPAMLLLRRFQYFGGEQ